MQNFKRILIPIVLLFITLLLDGIVTSLFTAELQTSIGIMVPRLFVLTVIILAFHLEPRHIYILTIVFGFIYDSYYSGILGIYMTVLMLITYFVITLRPYLETHLWVLILISIILLTINEFFIFAVYRVLDLTSLTAQAFMAERLGATLALNTIFIVVLGYPLKQVAEIIKMEKDERPNKNRIM
ncbi:rod shape-determining protein MreD [Alkalibacterium iburiense]|uniref:Rod shape-determining protein MreD n=1 Tax=Alkalibacterium iburiense TaxID=290589 RepID=A0ABP3HJM8_9LACT